MNRYFIAIMRYTDKDPHKFYLKTLNKLKENVCTQSVIWLITNGEAPMAEADKNIIQEGFVDDFEHVSGKEGSVAKLPYKIAKVFEIAKREKCTHVILLDDDTYLPSVQDLISNCEVAFNEHNAGACGPITKYRMFSKFANVQSAAYMHELTASPFTTYGCQCYSLDALDETKHLWRPMLLASEWRSDFPFSMILRDAGFSPREFWLEGYDHTGSTRFIRTEDAWIKRMVTFVVDYTAIEKVIRKLDSSYAPIMYKIRQYELNLNYKTLMNSKVPIADWPCLISDDVTRVFNYYIPIAKEKELL